MKNASQVGLFFCGLGLIIVGALVPNRLYAFGGPSKKTANRKAAQAEANAQMTLPPNIPVAQRIKECPEGAKIEVKKYATRSIGSYRGSGGWIYEQACHNRDGNFNGPVQRWFANGQLFTEHAYLNGMPKGEWKSYYPNGAINMKAEFSKREDAPPEEVHIPAVRLKTWYRSGSPACEYYGAYTPEGQKKRAQVWDQKGRNLASKDFFMICGGDPEFLLEKICKGQGKCMQKK